MKGRIKLKLAQSRQWPTQQKNTLACPLCGRLIPVGQRDAHHLLPKSRGGVETVALHRICHRQIHALLSEVELERDYQTMAALLAHPEIQRFVQWVRSKPDNFYQRTRKSQRLRSG